MSYFSHQFLHPSSVQNPTPAPTPTPTPIQHDQILNSQIQSHFQTVPSIDSSSIHPQFNPHVINPYHHDSGVYHSNYSGIGVQVQQQQQTPINYSANNAGASSSSSWVVTQAPPIMYSTAIQPVRTEAVALTSYEAPPNYNLIGQMESNRLPATPVKLLVSQSVRCELCNIECNTVQIYEKHLAGKKHAKCLAKLYAPALQSAALQASQSSDTRSGPSDVVTPGVQGTPGVPSQPVSLEVKNQEQSTLVCKLCNVMCTGEAAFADHLAGKKHIAKERVRGTVMNPTPVETNAQHTVTKKRKIGEPAPAWCDVCKISCTNSDGLSIHFVGKKHQKNLQKLMTPASVAAPVLSIAPSKGVQYNTTGATSSVPNSQKSKKKVVSEDVETRKQNILNNGAAAAALRTCTICNVVCNSEKVFRSHLTGQKHASMVMQARAASAGHKHASMVEQADGASASTGLRFAYPSA